MASWPAPHLQLRFASALPSPLRFLIHHIVSEPFACPELFSAPPNEDPEPTVCESHFLSASIVHNGVPLQAFAIEVYVYSTDTLTTIFVSKADSTGYLRLENLPKGILSPIRAVVATFLDYLVEPKRRKDARLVLSLFARAQNQYLFPGSIENKDKHVLDDRGLIKWWCRVANLVLDRYSPVRDIPRNPALGIESDFEARAHLVVPGCDASETRVFFPRRDHRGKFTAADSWTSSDPLQSLGKPAGLPTRCYIPRFPDDPKARFVIDLDDELPEKTMDPDDATLKATQTGQWRSVRSLSQFWELMAFRQECAAGRLVGFLWAVLEPVALIGKPQQAKPEDTNRIAAESQNEPQLPTPQDSQNHESIMDPSNAPRSPSLQPLPETLLTPVPSFQPQISSDSADEASKEGPSASTTEEVVLPPPGKPINVPHGAVYLSEPAYKRVMHCLDRSDYANMDIAIESSKNFLESVAKEAGLQGTDWGYEVIGKRVGPTVPFLETLSAEVIAKSSYEDSLKDDSGSNDANKVQTLGAGLVRKKKRPAADIEEATEQSSHEESKYNEPKVLEAGLVRKKPKV